MTCLRALHYAVIKLELQLGSKFRALCSSLEHAEWLNLVYLKGNPPGQQRCYLGKCILGWLEATCIPDRPHVPGPGIELPDLEASDMLKVHT